jgi:hypothetical protein
MEIEIEFISSKVLGDMIGDEKMRFILDKIRENKILVIEESLSPLEETMLIKQTMNVIDEKFPGIEVSTLKERTEGGIRERLIRLLGGRTGGLTVVGPSKLIRKVKKEPQKILLFAEKKK